MINFYIDFIMMLQLSCRQVYSFVEDFVLTNKEVMDQMELEPLLSYAVTAIY